MVGFRCVLNSLEKSIPSMSICRRLGSQYSHSQNRYFQALLRSKSFIRLVGLYITKSLGERYHATACSSSKTMTTQPWLKLYTDSTPNGIKISMALEELGLAYEFEHIDISTNRQKEPWYLEINPNGRIPAIVDTSEDGEPIRIFEGGSILQYLTERYDSEHKLSFLGKSRVLGMQ